LDGGHAGAAIEARHAHGLSREKVRPGGIFVGLAKTISSLSLSSSFPLFLSLSLSISLFLYFSISLSFFLSLPFFLSHCPNCGDRAIKQGKLGNVSVLNLERRHGLDKCEKLLPVLLCSTVRNMYLSKAGIRPITSLVNSMWRNARLHGEEKEEFSNKAGPGHSRAGNVSLIRLGRFFFLSPCEYLHPYVGR
jgi:hypothetical protein